MLSGKRCGVAKTTRMLAYRQPLIQRVRNSSLVEWLGAENSTGLKSIPKLGLTEKSVGVGERCVRGEVIAEAVVDFTQVRMPE